MSHRIHLTVDDATYLAIAETAAKRNTRPTTIAAAIITQATNGEPLPPQDAPPAPVTPTAVAATEPRDQRAGVPTDVHPATDKRALWLQLDRGPEWQTQMWNAAQELRAAYPDLTDAFRDGWHTNRFTRDGILALTIWRAQLDNGNQADPRLELQWLAAMRDFKRMYDEHRRYSGTRAPTQEQPADW